MRRSNRTIRPRKPDGGRLAEIAAAAICSDPGRQSNDNQIQTGPGAQVGGGNRARDAGSADTASTPGPPVAEIVDMINRLDPVGLQQVAQHVGALLRAKSETGRARAATESDWLMVFRELLDPLGIVVPPQSALSKARWAGSFRKGLVPAEAYVDCMRPGTPGERVRGRLIVARTLIAWMRKCNVPVSFKSCAMNLQNSPTSMESSYPGWRACGMLGALVRQPEDSR